MQRKSTLEHYVQVTGNAIALASLMKTLEGFIYYDGSLTGAIVRAAPPTLYLTFSVGPRILEGLQARNPSEKETR